MKLFPMIATQRKAFSLVEILIALALFGIAAVTFTTSIASALLAIISFEKAIEREEDLRFLRASIPYELSKDDLLAGGTIEAIHAGRVQWSATLAEKGILDFWDIGVTYSFPDDPQPVVERYERLAMGWMDEVDRSSKMTEKKESYPSDNRLSAEEAS
jgi:prepilin-type N-terminal cleavage/methylation domain-containing protein